MEKVFEDAEHKLERLDIGLADVRLGLKVVTQHVTPLTKNLSDLYDHVDRLSKVLRPTEEELHRRALLETEIAESVSYTRHRIDKIATHLNNVESYVAWLESRSIGVRIQRFVDAVIRLCRWGKR